jgi:hypothetical protein
MKWTANAANPPGKIQVSKVNAALRAIDREHTMSLEKSGIIGKTDGCDREREGCVGRFSIGGDNPLRPDVVAALTQLGEKYAWTVSRDNAAKIVADAEAALPALIAARPVVDNRITQESADQQAAEMRAMTERREAQEEAKTAAFISAYGSGETITIQPGYMAVTAKLCYDDSDSMSDYYHPHAPLGPELVLLVCPKGREDEATARRGLNAYPELAALGDWNWKTEKYSMGQGNYLTGPAVPVSPEIAAGRKRYNGPLVDRGHWNIEFETAYSSAKTLPAFKGYPGLALAPTLATESIQIGQATVTENKAKGGIEIRFPAKPASNVLDQLKSHGWRWSRFSACWYHRADDVTRAWVKAFLGSGGTAEQPGPDRFDMQVEDNMAAACGL